MSLPGSSCSASGPASATPGVDGTASNARPGVSSSSTVARSAADTRVYSVVVAVDARCVTDTSSSTPSSSCCAVSVTVCGVAQSDAVNVSDDLSVATAPASALATATVVVALGSVERRTA